MQPHKNSDDHKVFYDYVEFPDPTSLLVAVPLCICRNSLGLYCGGRQKFRAKPTRLSAPLQNLVFIGGAAILAATTVGYWRRIYTHIAVAGAIYMGGVLLLFIGSSRNVYLKGGLYDLPVMMSFLWLGSVGIIANQTRGEETKFALGAPLESSVGNSSEVGTPWASRLARLALFSLPLIGFWCMKVSQAPIQVRDFRILVTLGAALPLGFLAFLRHELVNRERLRLLRASQESLDNLKRLQTQFVQSEKLASIGQLVGGAAHEINNPLTAILGYSELLADDPAVGDKARNLAEKIREQARRTRALVNNLLSFARQSHSEPRSPIDINTIVNTSAQFRRFDLRGQNIRIEVQTGSGIPEVRADMNQLLQVFSNIINNAVDAMQDSGGGVLTVRTLFENGNVAILFSDTGPGMRNPQLVFDPFYTTKPVGKGTGLGLSICYGVIRDQGGQISCYNRPEGGATFRIELPAVPAALPFSPRSVLSIARKDPSKIA